MATVHALFWFDVEDCSVTQSDDAAKRLALILERHGVRGTMKLVGQKARMLEQRVRYDVIDALRRHDVGYHANWHGLRPQVVEYLAPLDWEEGVAEFERREWPGLADVRRLFGTNPVTYGQPGPNWAPQAFPVLRKWGIPTYVSGFGYVGLDCQPFYYGGLLCTSHLYGKQGSGDDRNHLMGLNFELGAPGELEKHQQAFTRSREQLASSGGLVSILNHPCTLVMKEWFSTELKSPELIEAGYRHFEQFLEWLLAQPDTRTTCASELLGLYPDLARNRRLTRDEVGAIAAGRTEGITFHRLGDMALSAAEAFGVLANALRGYLDDGTMPERVLCVSIYNPMCFPGETASGVVTWDEFCRATVAVADYVNWKREVPHRVSLAGLRVPPGDYLAALAGVLVRLLAGQAPPAEVRLAPAALRFEDHVDEGAARSGWASVMMPPGFTAPRLLELAKLGAWTLKPAILRG